MPDVYTQFRKAVESEAKVRPALQLPDQLKPLAPGVEEGCIPTMEDLGQKGKKTEFGRCSHEFLTENQKKEASQGSGCPSHTS